MKSAAPVVKMGRKSNKWEAAQCAQRALEHRYVCGQVQKVRAGLGSRISPQAWARIR